MAMALGFWMWGLGALPPIARAEKPVEQWGIFEIALDGVSTGKPFLEVDLSARFSRGDRALTVSGFYDGDGDYRIRFMPDQQGRWRYETRSNRPELDGKADGPMARRPGRKSDR